MNTTIATIFCLVMFALILIEALLAYEDKRFFFISMSRTLGGLLFGTPFLAHGGMWSDLIIVTPMLTAIVTIHSNQWSLNDHLIIGPISCVASALLNWFWAQGTRPDCLAGQKRLTRAGWVHAVYATITIHVILLFYFRTTNIENGFLCLTSSLLALHVLIGTHLAVSLIGPKWWKELNNAKDPKVWVPNIVIWLTIAIRTWVLVRN